jgi:hypothetical protein
VGALTVALACAFGGCTNNVTALVYTPITGIVIRSADLVAGHGCGRGPGQVYAYVAVLAPQDAPNTLIQSAVVSCYADAVLSNLPYDAGSSNEIGITPYFLHIYAYDYASFPAALACAAPITNSGCPGDIPDAAAGVVSGHPPTWTTTCVAGELPGEPLLAHCQPLEPTAPAETSDAAPAAD